MLDLILIMILISATVSIMIWFILEWMRDVDKLKKIEKELIELEAKVNSMTIQTIQQPIILPDYPEPWKVTWTYTGSSSQNTENP